MLVVSVTALADDICFPDIGERLLYCEKVEVAAAAAADAAAALFGLSDCPDNEDPLFTRPRLFMNERVRA